MIVVKVFGGLGNQMFQYALGKYLAIKNNSDLYLDLSWYSINKSSTKRKFQLDIFNTEFKIANSKIISDSKPFILRLLNTVLIRLKLGTVQTHNYFIEDKFSFNSSFEKIRNYCYVNGYWQSPLYFQSIESIIREDFKFPMLQHSSNIDIEEKIKKTNSVGIHLRRGDFINSKHHGIHGICSLEYYQSTISYVSNKIDEAVFFIFSDDVEWVKENFNFDSRSYYISGNNGTNSYIDMQLMSGCKHNIIANSSFSWWGAWLNTNSDKIIIAPKQWFFCESLNKQTNDLMPETWIRL